MSEERRNGYINMVEDIAELKATSANTVKLLDDHKSSIKELEKQGVCVVTTLSSIDETLKSMETKQEEHAKNHNDLTIKVASNSWHLKVLWTALVAGVTGLAAYIWKLFISITTLTN